MAKIDDEAAYAVPAARWIAANLETLTHALVVIAQGTPNPKNTARNALDDVGIRLDYDDEDESRA